MLTRLHEAVSPTRSSSPVLFPTCNSIFTKLHVFNFLLLSFVRGGKKNKNTFSPSKNKPSVRNNSPWSTSRSKLPDFLGGWTLLQRKSGNRQMERDSKGMDSCCTLYRRYRLNHSQHSTYWCPSACRGTQWFPPSNSRLAWKLQLFLKLLSVVVHTF